MQGKMRNKLKTFLLILSGWRGLQWRIGIGRDYKFNEILI